MTITTPIKPNYVTIEDETYGKLTVRPFGAVEELRLDELFNEASDAIEVANKIEEQTKEGDKIDEKKAMAELAKLRKKSLAQKKEAISIFKRVVTGEKADQLFDELPMQTIRNLITEALQNNG